jgi:hypothetical protein
MDASTKSSTWEQNDDKQMDTTTILGATKGVAQRVMWVVDVRHANRFKHFSLSPNPQWFRIDEGTITVPHNSVTRSLGHAVDRQKYTAFSSRHLEFRHGRPKGERTTVHMREERRRLCALGITHGGCRLPLH